jgi:uncharacterized protein (DUF111 family)
MDHRYHAETRMVQVDCRYGCISAKQKIIAGEVVQTKPEFDDLLDASKRYKVPIEEISQAVQLQLAQNRIPCNNHSN